MREYKGRTLGLALIVLTAVTAPGCNKFLDVTNPNNLEAENINPDQDARLLGQSVYQKFVSNGADTRSVRSRSTSPGTRIEAWVGDTYPTRNDFGRRDIPWDNGHINTMWSDIHENISFARTTIARSRMPARRWIWPSPGSCPRSPSSPWRRTTARARSTTVTTGSHVAP